MDSERLYALRGAVRCDNEAEDILRRVVELYDALVLRNRLRDEDIVSVVLSVTKDLDALNPAAALRRGGRASELALFSVAEPEVRGSLPGVIRILIHCYLPSGSKARHAYLNGAEALRPDRASS